MTAHSVALLAAAGDQLPEDVGKAGRRSACCSSSCC